MEERIIQFRVGVMVFATLIITAILAVLFGEMPQWAGKQTIYIRFDSVPGVSAGTKIRKNGIRIGEVTAVEFASDVLRDDAAAGVIVTAEIDKRRTIYRDELCVARRNLLGDAELEFVQPAQRVGKPERLDVTKVRPDQPLRGHVYHDPLTVVSNLQDHLGKTVGNVAATSASIEQTSDEMRKLIVSLRGIVDEHRGNIGVIVTQSNETLKSVQVAADQVRNIIGDPEIQQQLKATIARMPQVVKDAQDAIAQMRNTMDLVDRNLRNMEGFTEPLGRRGPEVLARLDALSAKADVAMDEMTRFTRMLSDPDGTLSRVQNDPELYYRLSQAARNVDELTRQMKPILADVRVITDKVARHPGVIVRDAVRPGPGIK